MGMRTGCAGHGVGGRFFGDEQTLDIEQTCPGRSQARRDTFPSRDEAVEFSVRKAKQIIDEQGARLFADGEPSGRA